MSLNSSDVFAFAAAGSQTEQSIGAYQQYVGSQNEHVPSGLTGWISEKATQLNQEFTQFVSSRLWEFSARLLGDGQGEYVGRFEVGYLGTISGLQNAEGLMREYIMANPNVRKLYDDDIIEGYGGDLNVHNHGIGRKNYFFRQANDGVARKEERDEKDRWLHSHFHDSIGGRLSFRERVNVHKTWAAVNDHLANQYLDITSPTGEYRRDHKTEDKEF